MLQINFIIIIIIHYFHQDTQKEFEFPIFLNCFCVFDSLFIFVLSL